MSSINKKWFIDLVKGWVPEIAWDRKSLDDATELLRDIAAANAGEIINDGDIRDEVRSKFAVRRACDVIQRQMSLYSSEGNVFIPQRRYSKEVELKDIELLPFVTPKKLSDRIDLNYATLEELVDLPGLGKVTGARIIQYRENVGSFSTVEEVTNIKGVSKADFEKFSDMVYIRPVSEKPTLRFKALEKFYEDPSFGTYCQMKLEEQATYIEEEDLNASIQERIIGELREIIRNISINKYPPYKLLPMTKSSLALEEISTLKKMAEIEANGVATMMYGRLLYDRQYLPFMEKLLENAEELVYVIMFFLKFETEKEYVTDSLVNRLIEMHQNGADIRFILDVDEEADPYDSKKINEEIHKYLKDKGVPVLFDQPEIVTHSKVVVVDSRHVILGSHNWTAGSLYQYDDTSVYIDSKEIAENYINDFKNRWELLSQVN